jgi:hypothetical protein
MKLEIDYPDDPFLNKMVKLFQRVSSPTVNESLAFADKIKSSLASRGLTIEDLHPYFVNALPWKPPHKNRGGLTTECRSHSNTRLVPY